MKLLAVTALMLTIICSHAAAADKKKSDLETIQGNWKVQTAKRGGKDAPAEIQNAKLSVEKDTFTLIFTDPKGKERKSSIQVKLDSSKSPGQIDFIEKGDRIDSHGIYKVEDKKLTICFDRHRNPRPTKFESNPDTRVHLMVFERQKK